MKTEQAVRPINLAEIDRQTLYPEKRTAEFIGLRNSRTLAVWRSLGRHVELRYKKIAGKIFYSGQDILNFLDVSTPASQEARPRSRRRKTGGRP